MNTNHQEKEAISTSHFEGTTNYCFITLLMLKVIIGHLCYLGPDKLENNHKNIMGVMKLCNVAEGGILNRMTCWAPQTQG